MTGRSRRRCVRRGGGVGGGREGGTRGGEGRPRSVGAAGGDRARSFDRRDARAGRPPRRRRTALASRLAPRRARPHLYTATKNMSATIANTGASLPVPRFRDMGCSDPPPREAGRFSSAGLVFPLSIASSRASHRPARARNRATRAPNLRTEEAARAKTTRRAGRDPARREGGVRARRGERNTRATQTRPTRPSHDERRNCAGSGAPCVTASNFFNRGSDSAPCDTCQRHRSVMRENRASQRTASRHGPGPREASKLGRGGGERQDVRARQGPGRVLLQRVPRERNLRAREGAKPVHGVRGLGHLRAREGASRVQGVRGLEHLRAREAAKLVQGMRGLEHLRAREAASPVQGVLGLEYLRARKEAK